MHRKLSVLHNQVKTVVGKGYSRHFYPESISFNMRTIRVGDSDSHGSFKKVSDKEETSRMGALVRPKIA